MEMMLGSMNKGAEPSPMIDFVIEGAESFGKISYLFAEDFEGTDYCKGLLFANEASKIVLKLGKSFVSKQTEAAMLQ